MYGFIEKWLAEFLDIDFIPYALNNGGEAAAINEKDFNEISDIILNYFVASDDLSVLSPTHYASNINGMMILLHKYYADDDVLDALTSEATKNTDQYRNIKDLGIGTNRFDLSDFKDFVLNLFVDDEHKDSEEDIIGDIINTTPAVLNEEEQPTFEDPLKKEIDLFFVKFTENFASPQVIIRNDEIKKINRKVIIYGTGDVPQEKEVVNLVKKTNKNIIFLTNGVYNFKTLFDSNEFNLKEIEKHTLIISLVPYDNSKFKEVPPGCKALCFGHTIKNLHVLHSSEINSEIQELRETEKYNDIEEILKNESNSPYAKFDFIFKDFITNVIWALKDRCFITFLYPMVYFGENESSSLIFKEFVRRINNDIKYEDLFKIDLGYYNNIAQMNKEEYVNFSVKNAISILKEITTLKEKSKQDYEMHFNKAMESGKMMMKYMNQIDAFDEVDMKKKEKEKALYNYNETIALDEVSSINIKDGKINVYTHNLYAQDNRSNCWHDIGTFHIKIGMLDERYDENNTIRIYNTKHQIEALETEMQAPHIFSDGHMCLGNLVKSMADSYIRRDLYEIIFQLMLFLQTANTDDAAGAYIDRWPEVSEEVANNADRNKDINKILNKISEAEKKFDNILADAIPLHS